MAIRGNSENAKFTAALEGKEIPILPLDEKWPLLFGADGPPPDVRNTTIELEKLLDKQQNMREKIKEVKRVKKKLLAEIIPLQQKAMNEKAGGRAHQLLDKHTGLVSQCNARIEQMEDEQIGLPREIFQLNFKLMLQTMNFCYGYMKKGTEQITAINKWISDVRVELKKQLIRKQESELDNYNIYTYMHQIFGPEVIDLFDMQYDPEKWHPRIAGEGEVD